MQEIDTQAVVLARYPSGEKSDLIMLYTKELGLVRAVARSSRDLKSKLSAHLEPLNLSTIRLVKKNQFTITDALAQKNYRRLIQSSNLSPEEKLQRLRELLGIFRLIGEIAAEEQPDNELWALLEAGKVFSKSILKVLGLDPDHATCDKCEATRPAHFLINEGYYLCQKCFYPTADRIVIK